MDARCTLQFPPGKDKPGRDMHAFPRVAQSTVAELVTVVPAFPAFALCLCLIHIRVDVKRAITITTPNIICKIS